MQCLGEIMPERGIDGLRIVFRLELRLINSNQFSSLPRLFPVAVIRNPVEPGRKLRFAAEAPDVFVSAKESLLRKIVGQCRVSASELAKQTPDSGLMISHQLSEGVVIIIEEDSGDEVCIGKRHPRRLGGARRIVGTGVLKHGLVAF